MNLCPHAIEMMETCSDCRRLGFAEWQSATRAVAERAQRAAERAAKRAEAEARSAAHIREVEHLRPTEAEAFLERLSKWFVPTVLRRGRAAGFGELVDWIEAHPSILDNERVQQGTWLALTEADLLRNYRAEFGSVPRDVLRDLKEARQLFFPPRTGFFSS